MTTKKTDYDYVVTVSDNSLFVSDSIKSSLPDSFFEQEAEDVLKDTSETLVVLHDGDEFCSGKLITFEFQTDQTVLHWEMRKSSALKLIEGKRFKSIVVKHDDVTLWETSDVPKLKDTVTIDLSSGENAYITLTVRKISMHARHS